jgi:exodeoxyribonuclease-5
MTVTPSPEQGKVIDAIVSWYGQKKGPQEFYLAGYAGVGKSTIANIAIEEIKARYGVEKVRTAAYTGKAASVLRKKGVEGAQTIHSLIYSPRVDEETGELRFVLSEESPAAEAELIVLDECSMVDQIMADDLRSFGKKILVMGDPGQLPPVNGQGAFTNREPDAFLTEIHRQCADSPILELATLARLGKRLPSRFEKGAVKVLPLTKETQPLIYREDTQPICGLNRVRWVYTQRIRAIRGFGGQAPEIGERLICCRNNHNEGLFNGGMGTLSDIQADHNGLIGSFRIDVQMEDMDDLNTGLLVDPYLFNNHFNSGISQKLLVPKGEPRLDEFDWGYVITCHKAQGSSWDHVTVIDDSGAFRDNRNAWLYTAITRAENGLTLLTRQ